MPPTTRSTSANSTPTKHTTRSTSNSATNTPTRPKPGLSTHGPGNANTPRKVPHCSKCGRPRAGHPRSGCPFVGDDEEARDGVGSDNGEGESEEEGRDVDSAVEALESMDLTGTPSATTKGKKVARRSLGRDSLGGKQVEFDLEDTKEAIRERHRLARERERAATIESAESLASISTATSELLYLLVFDGDEEEEAGDKTKAKVKLSRKMPGTMMTPFSSFVSTQTAPEETQVDEEEGKEDLQQAPLRPPGRTMSMQEREVFMDDLEALTGDRTKVYVLTDADVLALQGRIPKRGIYTQLVDLGKDRKLMVVGRDGKEVDALYDNMKKKGNGFAKGMVFGAAATFGGLAFA
ncbi:hypothetical protein VKT23_001609 [Stygiomarasmius scandens]|uniref:Uncharacterized protein n=1 Tax=Marasmiellus scandens TaxID=2682957 RepID=A0ABR1K0R8_9AGAR